MTCVALWIIIFLQADVRKIAMNKKTRLMKYFSDQLLLQLQDPSDSRNNDLFCLHRIKYTNVCDTSVVIIIVVIIYLRMD